jgi:hypothetical protein
VNEHTIDVFRAVNARIRELDRGDEDGVAFFVCECSDPSCFRTVRMGIDDYDGLREVRGAVLAEDCPSRPHDEDAPTLVEALTERVAVPVRAEGLPVEGAPAG